VRVSEAGRRIRSAASTGGASDWDPRGVLCVDAVVRRNSCVGSIWWSAQEQTPRASFHVWRGLPREGRRCTIFWVAQIRPSAGNALLTNKQKGTVISIRYTNGKLLLQYIMTRLVWLGL
jgi:hypothetical protein